MIIPKTINILEGKLKLKEVSRDLNPKKAKYYTLFWIRSSKSIKGKEYGLKYLLIS